MGALAPGDDAVTHDPIDELLVERRARIVFTWSKPSTDVMPPSRETCASSSVETRLYIGLDVDAFATAFGTFFGVIATIRRPA